MDRARTMTTYEAHNRYGRVIATFNALDLAEAYQADREKLGIAVTIRRLVPTRRAA